MRIYISGPISGTTDYMERFDAVENMLTSRGYSVINPAAVNANLPGDTTWDEYMKMSYTMLDMCDAIYMLKDWERSQGANVELERAFNRDMKIILQESDGADEHPVELKTHDNKTIGREEYWRRLMQRFMRRV